VGFSIGDFFGAAAPIIGGLLGGPAGFALGGAIGAGFGGSGSAAVIGRQVAPVQQRFTQPILTSTVPVPFGPVRQVQQQIRGFGTQGFGVQRRRVGLTSQVSRIAGGMFGAGLAAGGIVSDILRTSRENTGLRVTRNKVIDAAKACGIELAADTFGISEGDVCKVILAGRTRRRRGISAADVRRTKRTLRFVRTIKKDLKAVRL